MEWSFFLIDLEVQAFFVLDFFRTGDTYLSLRFAGVVLTISYEFPFFAVFFFLFCYVWFMFFFFSFYSSNETNVLYMVLGNVWVSFSSVRKRKKKKDVWCIGRLLTAHFPINDDFMTCLFIVSYFSLVILRDLFANSCAWVSFSCTAYLDAAYVYMYVYSRGNAGLLQTEKGYYMNHMPSRSILHEHEFVCYTLKALGSNTAS